VFFKIKNVFKNKFLFKHKIAEKRVTRKRQRRRTETTDFFSQNQLASVLIVASVLPEGRHATAKPSQTVAPANIKTVRSDGDAVE